MLPPSRRCLVFAAACLAVFACEDGLGPWPPYPPEALGLFGAPLRVAIVQAVESGDAREHVFETTEVIWLAAGLPRRSVRVPGDAMYQEDRRGLLHPIPPERVQPGDSVKLWILSVHRRDGPPGVALARMR